MIEDLNIKAFFFIYSSIFVKNPDLFEVYRYFRMNYFKNIEEFYKDFFKVYGENLNNYFNEKKNIIKKTKQEFPFYSLNDIRFRLVRDEILNKDEYRKIMFEMFRKFLDILHANIIFSKLH